MKVLFDHPSPFLLAHGGFQIQIEQTKAALEENGLDVEYLRWWDADQSGDIIHFFGRPTASYLELAHTKGLKVVIAELLGGLGARSDISRLVQRAFILSAQRILPGPFTARLAWKSYRVVDAIIALTPYEAQLMKEMFGAASDKVHVVPNGVENVFLQSPEAARGPWLICTATITPRKRVLETAEAALAAKTPLWFIGKPYAKDDPYYQKFRELCSANPELLKYEGAIEERKRLAEIYRAAHGFVLLSAMESLSLSALEAAACACPLLLSDLPWATSSFGKQARYCPVTNRRETTARHLRAFYDGPFILPPKPQSWHEVGRQLKSIYERAASTSR